MIVRKSTNIPNEKIVKCSKMLGKRIESVCLEDVLCTNNVTYYVSRK